MGGEVLTHPLLPLLQPLDEAAAAQPWDRERPWRAHTHLGWERGVATLDAHDLSAKVLRAVLLALAEHPDALPSGALKIIVGRGRHSLGAGGVLGHVVADTLGPLCAPRGWTLRPQGAAWFWVTDPARAPAAATGALGWGFWLLAAGFAACAVLAVCHG